MAGPIRISILANAAQAKREMNSVADSATGMGSKLGKFGKIAGTAVAGGLVVAGAAAVKFGVSAAKAAAEAQQNLGGAEAVFGKYADTIKNKGAGAYKTLGLAQSDYLATANKMGSLFQGSGLKVKESVDLTSKAMQRAADVASVMGVDASMAMESVAGAAKGNFTMMDNLGVSMNAANIEAYALSKGMNFKWTTATQAEKTRVAMKMFFEKTGKYAGNYEKESTKTLSGAMEALKAQGKNMMADVGMKLLPVLTSLAVTVSTKVLPAIERFGGWLQANVLPVVKQVGGQLKAVLVPAFQAIGQFLGPVIDRVKEFFEGLGSGSGKASELAGFFQTKVIPAVQGIITAFQGLVAVVLPIVQQVVTAIVGQWGKIQPYVQQVFTAVKQIIVGVMGIIKQVITVATTVIQAVWKRFGSTILNYVTGTFRNIAQFIGGAMKVIAGVVKLVLAILKGDWSGAWDAIKQILSGVWQAIKAIVKQGINVVKTVLSVAWGLIKAGVSAAWNGIKSIITNQINLVMGIVRGLKDKVVGFFSGAGSWLLNAGKAIIQGLLDGINALIGTVTSKLDWLTDKIPDWKGPKSKDKKLLRPTGRWIMEGLIKGFDDGVSGIEKSLGLITDRVEKVIAKRFDGKKQAKARKAALARAKKIMASEAKALEQNAKLREKFADRLDRAEQKLAEKRKERDDFAKGVRDSFLGFGNITQIQVMSDGAASIIRALKNRVEAAKQYAELLKQLRKQGLNDTTLKQLLEAGVEGGMATAKALAAGGPAAVNEVNSLMKEMATAGQSLGNIMGNEFYQSGIKAAQGLVQGLRAKAKDLAKEATALAHALVKAVKQALGIKSPSVVFKGIGDNVVKGLEIGLDETYVKRAGASLSASLQQGFGTPALDAYASQTGAPAAGTTYQITVQAPVGSSSADIGRELTKHLTAYERAGGRRRA